MYVILKTFMDKYLAPFLLFLQFLILSSCFYIGQDKYDDVMKKPVTEWSTRDALTVMVSCADHNLYDITSPNIKVIATPYFPSVVLASNKVWEDRKHITQEEFRASVEDIAKYNAGLYYDWGKYQFVDARGNYFRGSLQLDSLMFMVHMENYSWPCVPPMYLKYIDAHWAYVPVVPWVGYPCYIPDITDLEQRIYLVNDKNKFIRPKYVWGRRQNQFALPENLLVMFALRNEGHHFLEGSKKMYLVIKGFDADIKLAYDLSMIR